MSRTIEAPAIDQQMQLDTGTIFETELGWTTLLWRDEQLQQVTIADISILSARQRISGDFDDDLNGAQQELVERLTRYAQGERDDFLDVPLALEQLTPFRAQVVHHCRRIPWGESLSYKELAELGGSPRAARAVGNIMRSNPWPVIVPCHRVIASGGKIGGFSASGGLDTKRRMQALEAGGR